MTPIGLLKRCKNRTRCDDFVKHVRSGIFRYINNKQVVLHPDKEWRHS